MLHALVRYRLLCPVYCLMPDHAHVVWMGIAENSDQRDALKFFRTQTTPFLGSFTWQRQPFDHVLREHEREQGAFMKVCRYVLENPVRKEPVARPQDYAFSGAVVPGYPTLDPRAGNFWELFWKTYNNPR